MEIKNKVYQFAKMIKDIIPDKVPEGIYYNARNIRFVSADKEINSGFHFEKGNLLKLSLPSPRIDYNGSQISYSINQYDDNENLTGSTIKFVRYQIEKLYTIPYGLPRNEIERTYYTGTPQQYKISGKQRIIGFVETRKGVILFSTDNQGFDCIWYLKDINNVLELELLYMRNLGFSIEHPIESLNNYENDKIDKIYWVDTIHQLRHLNLEHSIANGDYENLIDVEVTLIDAIASINLSQPNVIAIAYGGLHTSGMIQYAYVLYKLNGSQTSLSPPSNLVPLGKSENQGGNINEIVGASPVVEILNLDTKYDNIIVYAIKYTSLNTTPEVSVIEDRTIPSSGELRIYDNGNIIRNSTLEELQFINSSLNFPGTITSKDNRLFMADFVEKEFKVNLDVRAYQFDPDTKVSRVHSNIRLNAAGNDIIGDLRIINTQTYTDDPDDKFDNINLAYDYYKYQANGTTRGGEGKYLKFELAQTAKNEDGRGKFFKDNEIYRLGIKFYNQYGQETRPMWICDFKAPQGNIEGKFNVLKFQLKPEFNVWLNSQNFDEYSKPVGYKILVAERTNNDKTIVASGLVSPTIFTNNARNYDNVDLTMNDGTFPIRDDGYENTLKSLVRTPSPLLRNAWLDRSSSKVMNNVDLFELIDSPMQRARHMSALFWGTFKNHKTRNIKWAIESPVSLYPSLQRYVSYQDTKIMQLYCPEAIFGTLPSFTENSTLEVRYGMLNTHNGNWLRVINVHLNTILREISIENQLNTYLYSKTSTVYPIEWLIGGVNGGFQEMSNFSVGGVPYVGYKGPIESIVESGSLLPTYDELYPAGYAGKGMFSNIWLNSGYEDAQHITVLQLFYRKYGNSLEEYKNTGLNVGTPINATPLPNLQSSDPKLKVINSNNAVSLIHDQTELSIDTTSIYDFVELRLLKKSGDNTGVTVSLTLNNETQTLFLANTTVFQIDKTFIVGEESLISNISVNIDNVPSDDLVVDMFLSTKTQHLNSSNTILSQINLNNNIIGQPISGGSNLIQFKPAILKPGSKSSSYNISHQIYGKPVYNKYGSGVINYNGNGYFKIANNMNYYKNDELGGIDNSADKSVRKMNVDGIDCITFVINPDAENDHKLARPYEDIVDDAKFLADSKFKNGGSIYCDIVKSREEIYLGGIYGGNSFEDRKRTNYLEVGDYYKINTTTNTLMSPGDTFVQDFKFLRMNKGPMESLDTTVIEHEEIVEYLTETTIDLMNRNDDSILVWNSQFSYDRDEYMKYNKVYSQQNILNASRELDYTFKQIDNFGSTVRASQLKTSGELYDSWLQSLVNETMDLDGKYGKITRLLNFNDNIYSLQEKAISLLSINPKVQVTSNEGYAIQLGSGQVLDDYKYITTTSGSLKWSNVVTPYGIYYVDSRNKTFNLINNSYEELSRTKGFIKFFKDHLDHNKVQYDNVYLLKGITIGYDKLRTEIYITYKGDENDIWTLGYNISQDSFSSFYDYNSENYIPLNDKLLSINPNDYDKMYEMYEGKPTTFYGEQKGAEITFIANPEHLTECTFHNLEYVDRSYDEDNIETLYTFSEIKVENEFQNSGTIDLTPRINLRKLNRKWRIALPRNNNKVSRMRNNWVKITLYNDNVETQNHELNDFVLYYTPNYKKLQ